MSTYKEGGLLPLAVMVRSIIVMARENGRTNSAEVQHAVSHCGQPEAPWEAIPAGMEAAAASFPPPHPQTVRRLRAHSIAEASHSLLPSTESMRIHFSTAFPVMLKVVFRSCKYMLHDHIKLSYVEYIDPSRSVLFDQF